MLLHQPVFENRHLFFDKQKPKYILNNSAKNETIFIIFDKQKPEYIWHQKIVKSPNFNE